MELFFLFRPDESERKQLALSFATDRVRVYLAVYFQQASKGKRACAGACTYYGDNNDLNEAYEITGADKVTTGGAQLVG